MADTKYEKVMAILEDERNKEIECMVIAMKDMKKTINPLKRYQCMQAYEMFRGHYVGIEWALLRIKRELES